MSIELDPPPFLDGSRLQLPIAIMASNRPHYLLRMLRGLQKVEGLDLSTVTVFIDGFWTEPASVTRLMGVKLEQHAGVSRLNGRIAQVIHACAAPASSSKARRISFSEPWGAFFWDYSGIGILGIDGIRVLLGAIPFSE